MRFYLFFLATLFLPLCCFPQRTIQMRNLWAEPQVHILYREYKISFKIRDIDRALQLLAETGDSSYGLVSGLDTGLHHITELYPSLNIQYKNRLQPLMQTGVGVFLLMSGHAEVRKGKRKKIPALIMNLRPVRKDDDFAYVTFADPKTNTLIFSGRMNVALYGADLGIE